MRYVRERVGEGEFFGLELVDGEVEPRDDLVDLACEDGELAFAHVAQAYVALAREHAVEVRRHVVERAVADRREGREDARDDQAGRQGAARRDERDGARGRLQGDDGRVPRRPSTVVASMRDMPPVPSSSITVTP